MSFGKRFPFPVFHCAISQRTRFRFQDKSLRSTYGRLACQERTRKNSEQPQLFVCKINFCFSILLAFLRHVRAIVQPMPRFVQPVVQLPPYALSHSTLKLPKHVFPP